MKGSYNVRPMRVQLLGLGLVAALAITGWTGFAGFAATGRAAGKDSKSHDWPAYSGDKASTKYSSLDQIDKDSVKKLQIAWRQSAVPAELKAMFPDAQLVSARARNAWPDEVTGSDAEAVRKIWELSQPIFKQLLPVTWRLRIPVHSAGL